MDRICKLICYYAFLPFLLLLLLWIKLDFTQEWSVEAVASGIDRIALSGYDGAASEAGAFLAGANGDYPYAGYRYENGYSPRYLKEREQSFPPESGLEGSGELPEGYYPVFAVNLSTENYNIINDTSYSLNEAELLAMRYPYAYESGKPLVLVVHTHGTESFFEESERSLALFGNGGDSSVEGYYRSDRPAPRSDDISKNIVRVGQVFTDKLIEAGIAAIHCEIMHDKDDYQNSYSYSLRTVGDYLERYPSIRYVIDIHRDSLVRSNLEKLNPCVVIGGKKTAQIMIVAGSDASGGYHPYWRENLSFFLKYKALCDSLYPSLSRPVYLRTSRFNQHVTKGSMILEIGSCGSTLEEAENGASLAAECLAKLIYENQ